MINYFIGIDPGITGGVAVLNEDGSIHRLMRFNGQTPSSALRQVLDDLDGSESFITHIALELVHAMPGQGVCSMFTFGVGYGRIQGWLDAMCLDFVLYTPQAWQKILPISVSAKERVKLWAAKKFGTVPFIFAGCRIMHQGCLDATAIAEFHRSVTLGLVKIKAKKCMKKKRSELRF